MPIKEKIRRYKFKMETIKPLTLEIDKVTWDKFKDTIPRTTTLNEAIIQLIAKKVGK